MATKKSKTTKPDGAAKPVKKSRSAEETVGLWLGISSVALVVAATAAISIDAYKAATRRD